MEGNYQESFDYLNRTCTPEQWSAVEDIVNANLRESLLLSVLRSKKIDLLYFGYCLWHKDPFKSYNLSQREGEELTKAEFETIKKWFLDGKI